MAPAPAASWLTAIDSLMDKLLISTSYSALSQGSQLLLRVSVAASTKDIFQMACTFLFFMIAVRSKTLDGLQNVLIMMAAQSFSSGVPLPQEPSGVLVLPAILLYFGAAAIIMDYAYTTSQKMQCSDDTATAKTVEYVVLFVAARGLARFQAIQQIEILGIVSLVYLLLPADLLLSFRRKNSLFFSSSSTHSGAFGFFIKIVECLANRGIVLWLISKIQAFTGVSAIFPNLFFVLTLLMCSTTLQLQRLQNCAAVFTYYAGKQIVQGMQYQMNEAICSCLLGSITVCMLVNGDCSSPLFNMVLLGTGILLSSWLENWVKGWSQTADWMAIYLLVFVILELVAHTVRRSIDTRARSESSKLVDSSHHNNIMNAAMDLAVGGIAHEQAMLGMPQVGDASGNH